jgi:DNA-binding transcriptional regulator GbsR (MarR family)
MAKSKEKNERQVIFMVQPSLYDQFSEVCEKNYKKVSETLRDLMLEYVKKQKAKMKRQAMPKLNPIKKEIDKSKEYGVPVKETLWFVKNNDGFDGNANGHDYKTP